MTTHEMITILTDYIGISSETVNCMTSINGYKEETCEDILYWATGYEDFTEWLNDNMENIEG